MGHKFCDLRCYCAGDLSDYFINLKETPIFHGKKLSEGDVLYVNGISFTVDEINAEGECNMSFENDNWMTVQELEMLGFSWNAK